jgi:hypothetical protein
MATLAMQAKYRLAREVAYADWRATFESLAGEPSFRDFVCLYLADGSKRDRNRVQVRVLGRSTRDRRVRDQDAA